MADRSIYLKYKYESSRILYWILQTSNEILKSLARQPMAHTPIGEEFPRELNRSGQVTVSGLLALATLISRHLEKTPPVILELFRSVIDGRTATHARFQQVADQTLDPDVIKSNASHKLFIDALQEAYDALGGDLALSSATKTHLNSQQSPVESKEDMDRIILTNKFANLHVQGAAWSSSDSDEQPSRPAGGPRKQTKPGKGKKGKRSKKSKTKTFDVDPINVPLDSYGIIQDADGIDTDYMMAVYDIFQQVMTIRLKMQEIWRDVAYNGLHTAVAGAVSHIAVGMIQRSAAAVFIDFPGRHSFDTMLNTATRGDIENSLRNLKVQRHLYEQMEGNEQDEDSHYRGWRAPKIATAVVDAKEHLLSHTYRALVDFIVDYQKNRNGKPTKKMLAQLKNWDPNFQLGAPGVTEEQRVQWRRSYTINWLYDLVNIYSSAGVAQKKEGLVLEDVDWSAQGPCGKHRRIFGLRDFAGFVTTLAMQKPGKDFSQRISLHHVFQLQLSIDSFAVSRGWSMSILWGPRVVAPPQDFSPRRDIELFLDRENNRGFHGFLPNAQNVEEVLRQEGLEASTQQYHNEILELVRSIRVAFNDWLGQSGNKDELDSIAPLRFSKTDPNGLWEYSPLLCGAGLAEALIMAYQLGLRVWDRIPDVNNVVHLHNMLHEQGFIPQAMELHERIEEVDMFRECFYERGAIPTSNYDKVLSYHRLTRAAAPRTQRVRENQPAKGTGQDSLSPELNTAFTVKSDLLIHNQAQWDPDRIADKDIVRDSMLMVVRLAGTNRVVDPVTGESHLEDTEFVRQLIGPAEGEGADERSRHLHNLARGALSPEYVKTAYPGIPDEVIKNLEEERSGYQVSGSTERNTPYFGGSRLTDDVLLGLLKLDMLRDVCGNRPLSGLNYLSVTAWTKKVYAEMEAMLKDGGYDMYFQVYESAEARRRTPTQKRINLVCEACRSDDFKALVAIAEVFEKHRAAFKDHMYWDEPADDDALVRSVDQRAEEARSSEPDLCTVA